MLKIEQFAGILPRVHPTLLPDESATRAHNCNLKSGKLRPLRQPSKVSDMAVRMENGLGAIGDAKTVHIWHRTERAEILAWPGIVSIAPSNLAQDNRKRLFVTGETGVGDNRPVMYAESTGGNVIRYDMTKDPIPAPLVSVPDPPEDEDNVRYTVFFQTWVDQYGYESQASMPSEEITYMDGDPVTVQLIPAPKGAVSRRIYKVVSGSESESIQFVAEQKVGGNMFYNFTFRLMDEDAGEVMPMMVGIPKDLTWMTRVPNDFYVGVPASNLREVRFSEVGIPVSWPEDYAYAVHDDIVGLAVTLNSVFVITKGMPWVFAGTSPEAMVGSVLASPQACISARSICVMEGAVFYISDDGICMLQDGVPTVNLLTEGAFSKREWQDLKPQNAIMTAYDGALHVWFVNENHKRGYIFELKDGLAAISTHDEVAKAATVDVVTDSMFFVREGV